MEDNTAAVAAIGAEMRRILDSEAYQTGLTLTRARIFSEWTNTVSVIDRESLHSELCALERLWTTRVSLHGKLYGGCTAKTSSCSTSHSPMGQNPLN